MNESQALMSKVGFEPCNSQSGNSGAFPSNLNTEMTVYQGPSFECVVDNLFGEPHNLVLLLHFEQPTASGMNAH